MNRTFCKLSCYDGFDNKGGENCTPSGSTKGIIAATGLWWRRVCTLELNGGADGWPMFVLGGHIFLILFRK